MDERLKILKERYRYHCRVAEALGVDRRTYLNYRHGRIPRRVSAMIDLLIGKTCVPPDAGPDLGHVEDARQHASPPAA